jgi:sugar phosphate isomerase/epimerase
MFPRLTGRTFARGALAVGATALLGAAVAARAPAAPNSNANSASDCAGRGVPTSKISIQLFTMRRAISSDGLESVLADLAEMGYRQVEPYSLHGNTPEEFAALLKKYHLKATAMHVSINEANWESTLEMGKTLGLKYLGAGGTPGNFTTAQQWIDYAEMLNRLGEQAQKSGMKMLVHNHAREFEQVYDGETAWDILMEYTDPRYVVFQLDIYWTVAGGADPVEVLEEYGDRIRLFHVKDRANGTFANPGEGEIDFPAVFDAAKHIQVYSVEHDSTQAPLETAEIGFDYLECVTY